MVQAFGWIKTGRSGSSYSSHCSPRSLVLALLLLLMICGLYWPREGRQSRNALASPSSSSLRMNGWKGLTTVGDLLENMPTSSCSYREYPWPALETGLPHLADVFASFDGKWATFIAVSRERCFEEFKPIRQAEATNSVEADKKHEYTFLCRFPDGTVSLSETILHQNFFKMAYTFRCPIPKQFQTLAKEQGRAETKLHVDLHALESFVTGHKINKTAASIEDTPKLAQLPLCSAMSSASDNSHALEPNSRRITLMTRLKGSYIDNRPQVKHLNLTMSPLVHLDEWISYHQSKGVDHFLVYDNDEVEGEVRDALETYIRQGVVTRVWYPFKDCMRPNDAKRGRVNIGQVSALLDALHRFGYAAEYFANNDVDEFFVVMDKDQNLVDFLEEQVKPTYDAITFKPYRMEPCRDDVMKLQTADHRRIPIYQRWECFSGYHQSKVKVIYRADRMKSMSTHSPGYTVDGQRAKVLKVGDNDKKGNIIGGLLAHYRIDNQYEYLRPDFEGKVTGDSMQRMDFMKPFYV